MRVNHEKKISLKNLYPIKDKIFYYLVPEIELYANRKCNLKFVSGTVSVQFKISYLKKNLKYINFYLNLTELIKKINFEF